MSLPDLSHLQMLVIEALGADRLSGRELRAALRKLGASKSAPAFYQLMARLEEGKFIHGEYRQKVIDGVTIKERFYVLTARGARAFNEAKAFYEKRVLPGTLPV